MHCVLLKWLCWQEVNVGRYEYRHISFLPSHLFKTLPYFTNFVQEHFHVSNSTLGSICGTVQNLDVLPIDLTISLLCKKVGALIHSNTIINIVQKRTEKALRDIVQY